MVKQKDNTMGILGGVIVGAVLIIGFMAFSGVGPFSITGDVTGNGDSGDSGDSGFQSTAGYIAPEYQNELNGTFERIASTMYLISPDGTNLGSATGQIQGIVAAGNTTGGIVWQCNDKGSEYTIYSVASDGAHTSAKTTVECKDWNVAQFKGAAQAAPVFKVKNLDVSDFVCAGIEQENSTATVNCGTYFFDAGSTFFSTADNLTGQVFSSADQLSYEIWAKINTTDDATFTDQSLLVGIDIQDSDDWNKPILSSSQATVTEADDCPEKTGNNNEYCYLVTSSGEPYKIRGNIFRLTLDITPQTGVNPDDDINVTFYTSGYVKSNVNTNDFPIKYYNDDSGRTAVYTEAEISLSVS